MPIIGNIGVLGGALFGALDRLRSNPVEQARKWLQNLLLLTFALWLVMSLFGRRLAAEGEPEASREFDVSDWVDAKLGEAGAGDAGAGAASAAPAGTIGGVLAQAGWPDNLIPKAAGVAFCESGGRAGVVNDWDVNAAAGTPSVGLFQIIVSTARTVDPSATESKLKDPVYNARIAYGIYRQQGWGPWACGDAAPGHVSAKVS